MFKSTSLSLIFKILGAGLQFIISILISRYFSASAFGLFSIALSISLFSATFGRLGFETTLLKNISSQKVSFNLFKIKYLQAGFAISFVISTLTSLTLFILSDFISTTLFNQIELSHFLKTLCLTIPFIVFWHFSNEIIRSQKRIILYSFLQSALQPLILLFVSLVAYSTDQLTLSTFISIVTFSYITSFLISFLSLLFILLSQKELSTTIKQQNMTSIRNISFLFLVITLSSYLLGSLDSYILSRYRSSQEVGFYSACQKFTMLLSFILVAFNSYLAPHIADLYKKKKKEKMILLIQQSTLVMTLLSLPLILIYLLIPHFFLNLFGQDFIQTSNAFRVLALAQLINVIFGPVGLILMMTKHQKPFLFISVFSLFVLLISCWLLIPHFGVFGASLAQLFASFALYLSSFIFIYRAEKFSTVNFKLITSLKRGFSYE